MTLVTTVHDDQFSFSSKTVFNILSKPQNIELINTMTILSGNNEHRQYIKNHINVITTLLGERQSQLFNLINEYHKILNDCSECNKLYICHFGVSRDEPLKIRPYPISFS